MTVGSSPLLSKQYVGFGLPRKFPGIASIPLLAMKPIGAAHPVRRVKGLTRMKAWYLNGPGESEYGEGFVYLEVVDDYVERQVDIYGDRSFWATPREEQDVRALPFFK
jgi:hypothetical protein